MKFKPAGIKTIREAINRLMNGEVFYSPEGYEDYEIIYDDVSVKCGKDSYNPFKVLRGNGRSEPVNYLWEKVSDWQTKCKWEDDIGDGVLCWVSDSNRTPCKHDYLRFITAHNKSEDYPYRSKEAGYRFATPLTLEEVKKYIKG